MIPDGLQVSPFPSGKGDHMLDLSLSLPLVEPSSQDGHWTVRRMCSDHMTSGGKMEERREGEGGEERNEGRKKRKREGGERKEARRGTFVHLQTM